MSETRKNNFSIDGDQVKEDDHVASYRPIAETETESRPKSQPVADEAEEKLLAKELEARVVTRVDMADAKYVVGDHRNGDARIELDANKRQFSGLTKEELLKYAEDPFWVRLRWCMFAAFWLLWLAMLGGAVAIIVRAPKCAPPAPRTWFEVGPLADRSSADYAALEAELPELARAGVQGVFVSPCAEAYQVLDSDTCLDKFVAFLAKARERSVKVIVDLTANYVATTHAWFLAAENRTGEYADYFVWNAGREYDPNEEPTPPNNWASMTNEAAWAWSARRHAYYLNQCGKGRADLNFHNAAVVRRFDAVLNKWVAAGVDGVRLQKARQLLVDPAAPHEPIVPGRETDAASLHQYAFLVHRATADQPGLADLLAHWSHLVVGETDDKVFTIAEDGLLKPEWHVSGHNASGLRPPSTMPIAVQGNLTVVARRIADRLGEWPIMQLQSASEGGATEVPVLAMLLPAAPLLAPGQIAAEENGTASWSSFAQLSALRRDASVQHGAWAVQAVPTNGSEATMLAVARWKTGHSGYVAVYNPAAAASANLTSLPALPAALAVRYVSPAVAAATNYTNNLAVQAEAVLVPAFSTVVLSYVPNSTAEQ